MSEKKKQNHYKLVSVYKGDSVYEVTIICENAKIVREKACVFSVLVQWRFKGHEIAVDPDWVYCPYCGRKVKLKMVYSIEPEEE